jgi:hypothetical protein
VEDLPAGIDHVRGEHGGLGLRFLGGRVYDLCRRALGDESHDDTQ